MKDKKEAEAAFKWFLEKTGISLWYAYLIGSNEIELHVWDYQADWSPYFDSKLKLLGDALFDTGEKCKDYAVPIYEVTTPKRKMKITTVYKGFQEICTC